MPSRLAVSLLLLLACQLACQPLAAQGPSPGSEPAADRATERGGIAWFGTWQQGLAEAKRTGKPILLMAAVPQCHGVPGVW